MNNLIYLQFFVSFLKRTGVSQGFRHETQKNPNKTEVEKTECPFFLDFFYPPEFTFQRDITFLFSSGNVVYNHFLSFILPTFLKIYFTLKSLEFDSMEFLLNISCEIFVTKKKSPGFRLLSLLPVMPMKILFPSIATLWTTSVKGAGPAVHLGTCCMALWPNSTWVLPGAFPYLPL